MLLLQKFGLNITFKKQNQFIIININNCIGINAIVVYLTIAYDRSAIKSVGPIITDAVRADKEALLYMTYSVFRPLLLPLFPVVIVLRGAQEELSET